MEPSADHRMSCCSLQPCQNRRIRGIGGVVCLSRWKSSLPAVVIINVSLDAAASLTDLPKEAPLFIAVGGTAVSCRQVLDAVASLTETLTLFVPTTGNGRRFAGRHLKCRAATMSRRDRVADIRRHIRLAILAFAARHRSVYGMFPVRLAIVLYMTLCRH